jgi:hypothetical protein
MHVRGQRAKFREQPTTAEPAPTPSDDGAPARALPGPNGRLVAAVKGWLVERGRLEKTANRRVRLRRRPPRTRCLLLGVLV